MKDLDMVLEEVRSTRKTLFILCGYPYAGKKYFARQIASETGAVLVSIDDIFHARGFDWNTNKLPSPDEWAAIFDTSYALAAGALQEGKNVLFDSTNQTRLSRDKLREVALSANAKACVVFIDTDEETIWKRWKKNAVQGERPVVRRELVAQTILEFEEPKEEGKILKVRNYYMNAADMDES